MFVDLSGLIAHNPPALHYGVAAADLDGDGQIEFFVAGYGGPNRILKWRNGALRDVAPATLADADRKAIGVAAADIDGDGREELYVLNTDAFAGPKQFSDRLFDLQHGERWVDLFSHPDNTPLRNMAAGRSVAAMDRRGTGRYGLFVANYGRPMRLYELGPDGSLADLAPSLALDLTTGGRGLWTGPLVSGRMDVFCANENGSNFLFVNDGDGAFREAAAEFGLLDADEHGRGVAALDADGDGRLDLVYGNWDGPHRLMLRGTDGKFRDRATPAFAWPSAVRTVIAADFDNDGYEELFFHNHGEPNRLFRVRNSEFGTGNSDNAIELVELDAGAAVDAAGLGTGAAVADIDGDGMLELLVACGESAPQPLRLFKCGSNRNRWLRVSPLTQYGAPARGALVRLKANGREQVRVVDAGSGYLCQMEPVAHFGLGEIDRVESVTVTWPDGASTTVYDLAAGQVLVVPYPEG